ncbi:aminotransferase class IV [Nitratifractor sp.]|uniref:aminotransferase class IV n=1 Tax=Nitratifractor sp. TaxID=2268144 RepID=UPI0025D60A8C|nr:aminotransferase class IV [Nitratifractor sp.]
MLLETIRIEEGRPLHLEYHNRRFNHSRRKLFGATEDLDLADFLTDIPPAGLWRCRVLYTLYMERVEYLPYTLRLPHRFALAEFERDYAYKYADRSVFERLKREHPEAEELLLYRQGLLTDTTIANIALRRDNVWYTPARPLLEGTTRQRLLEEGRLQLAEIPCDALDAFDELALMNAMIGFRNISQYELIR